MYRRLWMLSGLLCCATMLWSQDSLSRFAVPDWAFKTNFSSLLNPFQQSACLTVDRRLIENWTADATIGMMLGSITLENEIGESYTGLRIGLGSNYNFPIDRYGSLLLGFEGKRNRITNTVWQETSRQGGAYNEFILMPRKVNVSGLMLRFGGAFYMGKKKQWMIEPICAVGWRKVDVSIVLPPDAELVNRPFNFDLALDVGQYDLIDMAFRLNIGYCIW